MDIHTTPNGQPDPQLPDPEETRIQMAADQITSALYGAPVDSCMKVLAMVQARILGQKPEKAMDRLAYTTIATAASLEGPKGPKLAARAVKQAAGAAAENVRIRNGEQNG